MKKTKDGRPFGRPTKGRVRVVDNGEIYESAADFARAYGLSQQLVSATLRGHQKTCGGYTIEYVRGEMPNLTDADVPKGWFVLWCPCCFTSLAWTREDLQTYEIDEWMGGVNWATSMIDHANLSHAYYRSS